jgi:hypothetical protein
MYHAMKEALEAAIGLFKMVKLQGVRDLTCTL